MFKRSNSKASDMSGSQQRSPQIRPQYVNAAIRNATGGAGPNTTNNSSSVGRTPAHASVLEIPEPHAHILKEIAVTGKVPPTVGWEAVRDDICRPLIDQLLAVSLLCRSDVYLPNGKWIGSGAVPSSSFGGGGADGSADGSGVGANDAGSSQPNANSVGTPKTAPSTPLGAGGNAASNGRKKSTTTGNDSDSDNDNAKGSGGNNNNASSSSSFAAANSDVVPAVLDKADFEAENEYIMDQWCSLTGPTFTLQRLAELLLQHRRYHCYNAEYPYGAAPIALGGATVDSVGADATSSAGAAAAAAKKGGGDNGAVVPPPPRSPRSNGIMRGEKLQAAIRRCVLVAPLENL